MSGLKPAQSYPAMVTTLGDRVRAQSPRAQVSRAPWAQGASITFSPRPLLALLLGSLTKAGGTFLFVFHFLLSLKQLC